MPNLLHVIPVCDNAMLNWILQRQHTTLALSLVTNVTVFLIHSYHDSRHLWAAHNRWKDSSWGVITSKASLAHPRAIVHHESCNFFVTHDWKRHALKNRHLGTF